MTGKIATLATRKPLQRVEMSQKRRELILWITDNQTPLLPVMYYLTSYQRCDEILLWLVRNKLTGKKLQGWLHERFGHSLLSMVKFILMKIDKDVTVRPVLREHLNS